MSVSVREYRPEDMHALGEHISALVGHLTEMDRWESISVPDAGYGEAFARELLKKTEQEGAVFVAEDQGHIVGIIMGTLERPEDAVSCDRMKLWGRVLALHVSQTHQGKGVGKTLLHAMEAFFRDRKCEAVCVEVFAPNAEASHFYEKNGYDDWVRDVIKKLD